jgi:hypothetical protein
MWNFIQPVKLIRYLFVWQVSGALVRLPSFLPAELSLVLGTAIGQRLPTRQAHPWQKALAPWDEFGGLAIIGIPDKKKPRSLPDVSWPVEATLFAYPGKLTYGPDEPILWELKLMGEHADHGFFLEVILPAVEEIGSSQCVQSRRHDLLWGRFGVRAVYVARGRRWEPLVEDGRLDLNYCATPIQWAEDLDFNLRPKHIFDRLTWLTPYDLPVADGAAQGKRGRQQQARPPDLKDILSALAERMVGLLPGKYNTIANLWEAVGADEQAAFEAALAQAARIPVHRARMKRAPKPWPEQWMGVETFPSIPRPLIPYLDLASILHVGRHTHFGCGTFSIR